MDERVGSVTWSLLVGTSGSDTRLKKIYYTGTFNGYERLYAIGRDDLDRNMIASINTATNKPTSFKKVYTQTTQDYQISHIYVYY